MPIKHTKKMETWVTLKLCFNAETVLILLIRRIRIVTSLC
uniref:Uncharacterized protein n=1 Tax=Rhizophora mucronata TaxID=61149 RepID=A0A2P2MY65_RHIMU